MCGILGGKLSSIVKEDVSLALSKINHRGYDSHNIDMMQDVFLAHNRLSIVDLSSNGVQPLYNHNKTISAIVNGEFYQHEEILHHLKQKGYSFKGYSDSEILIPLYQEYGIDCLNYLRGEFAFILFDKNKEQFFFARDRIGIRPLNYWVNENKSNIILASEAKAILEFKKYGVEAQLDREAYWFSQNLQYLPQNKTLFKNISMLPPSNYGLFNLQEKKLTIEKYWDIPIENPTLFSFNEAVQKTEQLVEESISIRIPNEVKWCCHLSGGLDSSIIATVAKKYSGVCDSFTVKFTDDNYYDESQFAQQTSDYINGKLHIIPISFSDMLEAIPKASWHSEGLSINGHLGAKYLLNQHIHSLGYKVALTGEGSDEFFMGYAHLKNEYSQEHGFIKNNEKQHLAGIHLPQGEINEQAQIISQHLGFIPTWIQAKASMAQKLSALWSTEFKAQFQDNNPYLSLLNEAFTFEQMQYLKTQSKTKIASYLWAKYCLAGYILKVLDDGVGLAHTVESRQPFTDHKLIEFASSLEDSLYFYNNQEKAVLRQAFKPQLTQTIYEKTKQPFMSPPISIALNDEKNKKMIYSYILDNQKLFDHQLFNRVEVEKWLNYVKEHSHENQHEPILMTLLTTSCFIDNFKL